MPALFKCTECTYFTSVKSNLKRHVELKHTEDKQLFECSYCQKLFVTVAGCRLHMSVRCKKAPEVTPDACDTKNVVINSGDIYNPGGIFGETAENVDVSAENIYYSCNSENSNHTSATDGAIMIRTHVCDLCNKGFTRRENLKYHTGICKGIINILECPICKKAFASASSKSTHLAKCRLRAAAKEVEDVKAKDIGVLKFKVNREQIANIINNQFNINNTDNSVVNKNITNNIGILVFPDNTSNESIVFDTDLINIADMATTIKTLSKMQFSYKYIEELLKNPRNCCIKKTNMRSETSHVHTGGETDVVED